MSHLEGTNEVSSNQAILNLYQHFRILAKLKTHNPLERLLVDQEEALSNGADVQQVERHSTAFNGICISMLVGWISRLISPN